MSWKSETQQSKNKKFLGNKGTQGIFGWEQGNKNPPPPPPPGMSSLLLSYGISAAGHLLAVIGRAVSRRRDSHRIGGGEEGKHFLVLCLKGTIHDAVNDGVNGTANVPQAGGKEENLGRETNEKKRAIFHSFSPNYTR